MVSVCIKFCPLTSSPPGLTRHSSKHCSGHGHQLPAPRPPTFLHTGPQKLPYLRIFYQSLLMGGLNEFLSFLSLATMVPAISSIWIANCTVSMSSPYRRKESPMFCVGEYIRLETRAWQFRVKYIWKNRCWQQFLLIPSRGRKTAFNLGFLLCFLKKQTFHLQLSLQNQNPLNSEVHCLS